MRLASAVWTANRDAGDPGPGAREIRVLYRRMLRAAFHDSLDIGSLVVDGDDLRAAGVAPGPILGKILATLVDAVIDDPSRNARDWLLREASVLDKRFRLESGS